MQVFGDPESGSVLHLEAASRLARSEVQRDRQRKRDRERERERERERGDREREREKKNAL